MPLTEDEKAELVAYLDGELDDSATQIIETKIATNPDVRAELDALKQAWGLLDFLPKASPSPNFTNRTLERLTLEALPPRKPRRWRRPVPG
jgi:anti-sigma factor RsiW